jgi:hypothetical protein
VDPQEQARLAETLARGGVVGAAVGAGE